MEALAIVLYIVIAAAVVYFSLKLSDFVDLLDKKTNISGAFLGGILLAAVTSLPELFTSLTAVMFLKEPNNHFVLGNILGSNAFNLTLFFFVFVIFFKKMIHARVGKGHLITISLTALMYVVTTIASLVFDKHILWGWFNPLSIAVAIIYIISIWTTPKEDEADEKETKSKLTVKQIILLFILFSLLLIGASIGLTFTVDWLQSLFALGDTFAGALFLAVATSLPEMTATINLCRKRNLNAAYGNILGSGIFNFFIIAIADLLSFRCKDAGGNYVGIYQMDQTAFLLIVATVIQLALAVIATLLHLKNKTKDNLAYRILYIAFGVIILGSYIAAIGLSLVNLQIPFAPMAK